MAIETPAVSGAEFVRQFRTEIAAAPNLRVHHPFVKAVSEGTVSLDHIREWARQDYQFRAAVPRIAMLRYLQCSDPEIAAKLYEVVEEETEGLSTGSAGHQDLFLDFAAAIGLSRADLTNVTLAPATAAHLYFAELICYTQPWFVVMAAQMAAEGTLPPAARKLADGFMAHYGLSPRAVAFFTVHIEADSEHGSLAETIAERYITSPQLQAQTRAIAQRRTQLQYDVWTIET